MNREKCIMEMISGVLFALEDRISSKLRAAGATSTDTAVTRHDAFFDDQEQNWLNYIAGGLFAKVKKTKDKRYYVETRT